MFEGVFAPHPYCPHRQVAPVKAALALSLVATGETLQNGIFLFVNFFFLCLLSQKEKVEFLLVPYEITVSKVKYTFADFKLSLQKQDKA